MLNHHILSSTIWLGGGGKYFCDNLVVVVVSVSFPTLYLGYTLRNNPLNKFLYCHPGAQKTKTCLGDNQSVVSVEFSIDNFRNNDSQKSEYLLKSFFL